MKRFALIGAAGYIAERHMRAIKETGNTLVCALDCFDVMGRIDSYFPEAEYFQREEELSEFLTTSKAQGNPVDFVSICTPNFLHARHIELALTNGCDVICEKPLVIDTAGLNRLLALESETGKKVNTVLQLRYHPAILKLKKKIAQSEKSFFDVDLSYITSRGKWYFKSWKGDVQKSGGIATNIGIHFFDMLTWIFGPVKGSKVLRYEDYKAAGSLQLERARVNWQLSLDAKDLPPTAKQAGKRTFRSIKVDDEELDFTDGFTDLHTLTYQNILDGNGFGVADAQESIVLTERIREERS